MKLAPEPDRLAIHGNFVPARMDFCAERLDGLAIDADVAGADELFACATGGDAAFGKIFLEANQGRRLIIRTRLSRTPQGKWDQASALVLRKPVTRSPVFHWPRFLRSSTRS